MGQATAIQWCHHTFNGWIGCAKVSDGCKHCYAEALMDHRHHKAKWGENGTRAITSDANWKLPERWDRGAASAGERRRVFCSSLADVFEDREDLDAPRVRLFNLVQRTPNLDWLLLTKRPENWHKLLGRAFNIWPTINIWDWLHDEPPANVWMGVSVESHKYANERIPELLEIPAAVRFLSVEPLLGPIELQSLRSKQHRYHAALTGENWIGDDPFHGPHVDWVIIGGESGHAARPCDLAWIRSIRDQCQGAGVACFIKQLGARPFDSDASKHVPGSDDLMPIKPTQADAEVFQACLESMVVRLKHSHGGDPTEWPEDLRVRELPRIKAGAGS